jgi:methionyl-tRNA synthetase
MTADNILITTAISYTNGDPHIGHLYESILADFINRVHLLAGYNSKLLTGTDEHGKKIQDTAANLGISPMELCNQKSKLFREMNRLVETDYDYFIRTTADFHKDLVKRTLEASYMAGDIYKTDYEGWYNTREESYVSETQARETDYKDIISGKPLERISEETYNFRLSRYQPDLSIIYPAEYRDTIGRPQRPQYQPNQF